MPDLWAMQRMLALAALMLLLAVGLGAFGAHGLGPRLAPEALAQWHTAVLYQFVHALGMLAMVALDGRLAEGPRKLTGWLFLLGICCFSGSLYLLSTRELTGWHGLTPFIGPITPIGGLLFMAGWAWLLITAVRGWDQR
jgi:uncharacterized membrane protein YgdD (TMEM256/DUF423 family)